MHALDFDPAPLGWGELAIRFAAFQPGVTTALVGTTRLEHLAAAVRATEAGPLVPEVHARLRASFVRAGDAWPGVI